MTIKRAVAKLRNANMYVLIEDGEALIIDPSVADALDELLDGAKPVAIILTHEHYDHICHMELVRDKYACPVWCGRLAEKGVGDPKVNLSRYVAEMTDFMDGSGGKDFEYDPSFSGTADRLLSDGEMIGWAGHEIKIVETPGHSIGGICLLIDNSTLFCGDSLFPDLPTATRGPGGSGKQYKSITLPKLQALPLDTMVYPGHGEPFRLGDYTNWADERGQA